MTISEFQGVKLGFGFIEHTGVQGYAESERPVLLRTPRPGRPLLIPLCEARHIFLLVIQLDENGEPKFSILDSEAYHLNPASRQNIHNWALRLLRASQWWKGVCAKAELRNHCPPHTEWIPVSQQPTDNECGYYAILNGWTLALGLLPDPNVILDWSDQFFSDLQDVIHLARLGRADYSLIESFIKCRGFVLEVQVPDNRRSPRTTALRNPFAVYEAADRLRVVETGMDAMELEELRNANRINPPAGRRHNDPAAFPSDHWSNRARAYANALARNGVPTKYFTEDQLRDAYRALGNPKGSQLRKQFENGDANFKSQTRDEHLTACRNYLADWHMGKNILLEKRPCQISAETIGLYRDLFKDDFLGIVSAVKASRMEFGTHRWRPRKST
jgi:hypothetical protein